MTDQTLPLVVGPEALEPRLGDPGLLIVDLCIKPETYVAGHVPGAVHLDYGRIVAMRRPVGGLLPEPAQLSAVLSEIGLTPERHVVAYDDEGGGRAARLLWTLAVLDHERMSLLDGGLHAWAHEGHRLERGVREPQPRAYEARVARPELVADLEYVLAHLEDPEVVLVDARSPAEYAGLKRFAERGGHIPGAVNFEWTLAMDRTRNLRLRDEGWLRERFASLGVTPDKEVITYCQTHHRSAHTWLVLTWLGYPRVRGYPGSWSEWGNRTDTPVEL